MAVALTVNGIVYQYPTKGNKNWATAATGWATAVTAGMLQKAGGSFTLTAEVDFGGAFGLKALNLKSRGTPLASVGFLRMAAGDKIVWRNNANSGDNVLEVNGTDDLLYNGTDLVQTAGVSGPGSSTDNAITRWDGLSGAVIQNSGVLIDNSDNLSTPGTITAGAVTVSMVELFKALVPIGTIISHYDFAGALIPDPVYWVPCNGSVQTVGGVPRTTPDLSGRYIVGFGTDGGGDNNTAPFLTAPVGIAGNVINIAHTHTMAHTHDVNIATFTSAAGTSHSHTSGTLFAALEEDAGTGDIYLREDPAGSFTATARLTSISRSASSSVRGAGLGVDGTTAAESSHTHDVNPPNTTSSAASTSTTSSALSSAQSIQPRSIRVRYYMRAT